MREQSHAHYFTPFAMRPQNPHNSAYRTRSDCSGSRRPLSRSTPRDRSILPSTRMACFLHVADSCILWRSMSTSITTSPVREQQLKLSKQRESNTRTKQKQQQCHRQIKVDEWIGKPYKLSLFNIVQFKHFALSLLHITG